MRVPDSVLDTFATLVAVAIIGIPICIGIWLSQVLPLQPVLSAVISIVVAVLIFIAEILLVVIGKEKEAKRATACPVKESTKNATS